MDATGSSAVAGELPRRDDIRRRATMALVAAVALALSAAVATRALDTYAVHVLIMAMIWGVFAVGWNLASGFGGMKAFGHQGFFAIAAYASALLSLRAGLSPWLTVWLGACLAAAASLVVVAPVLRLRSTPQIAIVTLAFGEIVRIVIENLKGITNGDMGLIGIPPLPALHPPGLAPIAFSATNNAGYFFVALVLLLGSLAAVYALMASRYGLAILAIRDAPDAAASLGLSGTRYRVGVFTLSAFLVGLAGAFYAHYLLILTPGDASSATLMVMVVSMVIVGGHGTHLGPLVGAVVLSVGIELFSAAQDYQLIVYGVLVVAVMRFLPGGIVRLGDRIAGR